MSSRATALITVLVGSLWAILLFQRVLFDWDQATLYRDLGRDFLTQKAFWANSMRNGDGIPYWNHFALGGAPFLARNAVAPYHPFNFIFFTLRTRKLSQRDGLFFGAPLRGPLLRWFLFATCITYSSQPKLSLRHGLCGVRLFN